MSNPKEMPGEFEVPTAADLKRARDEYVADEPRDLFYRVAGDLVAAATYFNGSGTFTLAEALNVLLFTWNRRYYNRNHPADQKYWKTLESILDRYKNEILSCRQRSIDSFVGKIDAERLMPMFRDLALTLGPVGAAKALHLLAPKFFPPWDNNIAYHYGIYLSYVGEAEDGFWWKRYTRFIEIRREQVRILNGAVTSPLKALDEWDYMRVTRAQAKASKTRRQK
jgi:hypothetical protein